MKAVVLGAGVVGVTTAYELARDGHDVTVIDRREGPALETSFANGGQLSWDHGEPLAQPGVVLKALKWLGRKDAPLLFHLRADPALWSWTLQFLASSAEPRFWRNAERVLRVALYARERLHAILKDEDISFDHLKRGIIGLYHDPREFDHAMNTIRAWREIDNARAALDRKGCLALEPALGHSTFLIAGGIHAPHDESGDCHAFTSQLADRAKTHGVQYLWNTDIEGLAHEGGKITHAVTSQGNIAGDVFVMALGSYSPRLMRGLDLKLPIYPAKGYSVTLPIVNDAQAPTCSLTSHAHKVVFSRLGGNLRAAGTLELGRGYDTQLNDARARLTLEDALKLFPGAGDAERATFWTGLRPLTPDSVPIVGRAKQDNLFLNTGHGMLGWTMATGTARLTADLIKGHATDIDMDGLGWERFS